MASLCEYWTGFPLLCFLHPRTMLRLPRCFEATRFAVGFEPKPVGGCITPHNHRRTIDDAHTVFLLKAHR